MGLKRLFLARIQKAALAYLKEQENTIEKCELAHYGSSLNEGSGGL